MAELYLTYEYHIAAMQLILAMLGMGATLTGRDFREIVRSPKAISAGLSVQLLAVPLLALAFISWPGVSAGVAIGIALVAAIPGGTVSNIFTYLARGDIALSISITTLTTIACLVTTPLILDLLIGQNLPADFVMPRLGIVIEIGFTLLLPLLLGMAFLQYYPRNAPAFSLWCIRGSLLGVLMIVVGSLLAGRLDLAAFGVENVVLVSLFSVALAMAGWLVPRLLGMNRSKATAIELEVVVRNVNLGVLLKVSIFPASDPVLAPIGDIVLFTLLLYGGIQLLIGAGLIRLRRGQNGEPSNNESGAQDSPHA
ncbi:MAG: bile acid:sodium symporter [Haliea sp.]|nr:bile acid:sodium symporter [Haliea sp.]